MGPQVKRDTETVTEIDQIVGEAEIIGVEKLGHVTGDVEFTWVVGIDAGSE